MWTPTALASETRGLKGQVWRVVEHQYTASTRKIVESATEQDVLEQILESSKPPYPTVAVTLHYLLKTPFRYDPPNPNGSRFRRAGERQGVFYGSEHIRAALAELSYWRVCFFLASPETPLPRNEERLTAFRVKYVSEHGLDLTLPPLDRDRRLWTDPADYTHTQFLAENARQAGIDVLRYESVRDETGAANIALLAPTAFAQTAPDREQTWYLYLSKTEITCRRANALGEEDRWTFQYSHFATE